MSHQLKPIRYACVATFAVVAAFSNLAVAGTAASADKAANTPASTPYMSSDRAYMNAYGSDRDALQAQLKPGMDAAFYRKKLRDLGYQITAVNDRESDYIEYEVVKGRNSHEVQIEFDDSSKKATEVEVSMNMWRADSTEAALKGQRAPMMTTADYSDRAYRQQWMDEKEVLEKALGSGHDKGYYPTKLKELGYMVTATLDREDDYREYEIVKGTRTYEVQIDFDKASGMSSEVKVEANMWNADATERAISANRR
jgi:uncharacterized protein YmfQ (DUF2313 family)